MSQFVEEVTIVNKLGMHLRPAQQLVQTVLPFRCDVHLENTNHKVNAKSIMGLLTLAASQGARLTIICDGDDAEEAMSAIVALIESGFGEDD